MSDFGLEDELREAATVFTTWSERMVRAADHQHKAAKLNDVFFKYLDRLFDPTPEDSLEKIVAELKEALEVAMEERDDV